MRSSILHDVRVICAYYLTGVRLIVSSPVLFADRRARMPRLSAWRHGHGKHVRR